MLLLVLVMLLVLVVGMGVGVGVLLVLLLGWWCGWEGGGGRGTDGAFAAVKGVFLCTCVV